MLNIASHFILQEIECTSREVVVTKLQVLMCRPDPFRPLKTPLQFDVAETTTELIVLDFRVRSIRQSTLKADLTTARYAAS